MKKVMISLLFVCTDASALDCTALEPECVNPSNKIEQNLSNKESINSMINDGVITKKMDNARRGVISNSMINNGTIGEGYYNQGAISGNMINNLTVYLYYNQGVIVGNMINNGSMTRDMSNTPTGIIGSSMINGRTGSVGTGMNNNGVIGENMENSGYITRQMSNAGTISGSLINNGSIGGNLINTGIITRGILNSGTITGQVQIGDAPFTLVGNHAVVYGAITGNDASSFSVGATDNPADYSAASGNNASVGSIAVSSGSTLTLADGVTWAANGTGNIISNQGMTTLRNSTLSGNLNNTGVLSLGDESNTSATVSGNVINSGSLILNPTEHSAGNTLTISGNYVGTPGSSVRLGTVLGGDNSLTDLLNITGDTSGQSTVYVTNENGAGAQTLEGVKVIAVGGTSAADFSLGNRVVAGAYDYRLKAGAQGWYLTSTYDPAPAPSPGPTQQIVRPEVGSYISNIRAANILFSFSLHDREGGQNFTGMSSAERDEPGVWMRNEGGYKSASTSDGQNHTDSARYVLQMGGDVARWSTDNINQFSLGLMGGYASQHSNTRNALTGYRSQADIHGYSAGVYATLFQNAADKTGLYANSWLQYSWFNNQVKGDGLKAEHYDSRGLSALLESGYTWRVSKWKSTEGLDNALYVEPHAQAVWSDVDADNLSEANGTRVSGTGNDNVELRLGVRTYLNGKSRYDRNTIREFQPFIEANWIYNTQQYGVRMNDAAFRAAGERNVGELKTGVEARLGQRLSGWIAVAQQMGGSGYHDSTGSLGISYSF